MELPLIGSDARRSVQNILSPNRVQRILLKVTYDMVYHERTYKAVQTRKYSQKSRYANSGFFTSEENNKRIIASYANPFFSMLCQ